MKYIIFNIILLCTLGLTKAQVFNNIYNNYNYSYYNPNNGGFSLYNFDALHSSIIHNDLIYSIGSTRKPDVWGDSLDINTYIVVSDIYGDTIKTREININPYKINSSDDIIFIGDNSIFLLGVIIDSTGSRVGAIINCDTDFNYISHEEFRIGDDAFLYNYTVCPFDSNIVYILGYTDIDTSILRNYDILILKKSISGNVLDTIQIGGLGEDRITSMQFLNSGNILLSGYTDSYGAGDEDIYLLEIDTLGNIIWQQTYGFPGTDVLRGSNAIYVNNVNEYYLCGSTELETGDVAAWLIKTDNVGNLLWDQKYNRGEFFDGFENIQVSKDGNIILAGGTHNYNLTNEPSVGWLIKVDTVGNIIWDRLISKYNTSFSHDYAYTLNLLNDGFLLTGYVINNTIGEVDSFLHMNDGWLCKTDSCGFTTGAQPQALLTIDSVNGPNVYISNLSEEYCTAILHTGNGDSLNIYAYSQWTNGTDPTQLQYTYTDTGTYTLTLYTYAGDGIDTFTTQVHISDTTTSIKDVIPAEAGISVSLFPNPTKDYVIVAFDNGIPHQVRNDGSENKNDDFVMGLYTPTGQLVQTFTLNPNVLQQRILLNNLANGVYFVNFMYNNKPFAYERISVVK